MKKVLNIQRGGKMHWVGNGFPVRTLFAPQSHGAHISPFLLLDYAGPAEFSPSDEPRGVGEHPHRGFETVTIVYQGELEHRDSAGNHGKIGPGDVQWMTAASGVVHEEWHAQAFTKRGGIFEVIQLWVNLPRKDKMSPPRYQEIQSRQIPVVQLTGGSVRVIAGDFGGTKGPANTFTPIDILDVRLKANGRVELPLREGHTALVVVLKGKVLLNGAEAAGSADLGLFDRTGSGIAIEAKEDAVVLVLSGEPIDEPVAAYGPFVMNTEAEIHEAIRDFQSDRLGRQPAVAAE